MNVLRKRTVRNGMRLVIAALILIIIVSFYHLQIADLFFLSIEAENRIYRLGIFWAAAIGSYGVVVTAIGFALSPQKNDFQVRLLPVFVLIFVFVFLFFYLLATSIESPSREKQPRVRPGETITI